MRKLQAGQLLSELIGRRGFSIAALALFGGAIIIGCAGGSNNATSPTTTASQGQNIGFVEGNHAAPHVAIISAAQLSAGDGVILDGPTGSIRTQ